MIASRHLGVARRAVRPNFLATALLKNSAVLLWPYSRLILIVAKGQMLPLTDPDVRRHSRQPIILSSRCSSKAAESWLASFLGEFDHSTAEYP